MFGQKAPLSRRLRDEELGGLFQTYRTSAVLHGVGGSHEHLGPLDP